MAQNHIKLYFLMGWMGIVPLISSATITIFIITHETVISDFQVWQWLLFYLLTILTMALAITPTTFISLVSGFFLGFNGLIPIIVSYQLASLIGYSCAGKLDNSFLDLIQDKYPKSAKMIDNVHHNQFGLTFLSRLSPALPFAIMNVVLSVSKIRVTHFFWGGLLGMLPRTLFFIWVGIKTSKLSDAVEGNENLYISIALSIAVVFALYKVVNRHAT